LFQKDFSFGRRELQGTRTSFVPRSNFHGAPERAPASRNASRDETLRAALKSVLLSYEKYIAARMPR
jgi:hypothetical protein